MTEFRAAFDDIHHRMTRRGHDHNWLGRNMWWVGWTIFIAAILSGYWMVSRPHVAIKMPQIDCTVQSGTSLVDCFGTNQTAYQSSIAFAERYGLSIQAKLLGTSETTTLSPENALKLDTSLVQISVAVNPGDEVIVPFDGNGNYVVRKATFIRGGKVIPPTKR